MMTQDTSWKRTKQPRILVVTPEITYLPQGMGNMANRLSAKAGGLADVSASLVATLFEQGADVHVALPNYRRMFSVDVAHLISEELRVYKSKLPTDRIHLAEDRVFYYRNSVYGDYNRENPKIALAFQREVINNIIPLVKPDLIHCNDWMTGLIPAMARRLDIPCLFTVHNIHTMKMTLEQIEEHGIDAAEFWQYLYYQWPPSSYEDTRSSNPVDLLTTGIFSGHYINTVSPTFLKEVASGQHDFVPPQVEYEMKCKFEEGCAAGILNAPPTEYEPALDPHLAKSYSAANPAAGKAKNKLSLQEKLGLESNSSAPVLFWPSRLDPIQKGPQLLTDILYDIVDQYWADGLQLVVVANGDYQKPFRDIVRMHDFYSRVAVCDFSEPLSHLAYAAADFVLMPSRFEPCGLPQMIGMVYGALPIAHDTGGLHDTIVHLDPAAGNGNGFLFETYDPGGLHWAIDRAMQFYRLSAEQRWKQVQRVMEEAARQFSYERCARDYINVYEHMLQRPLIKEF